MQFDGMAEAENCRRIYNFGKKNAAASPALAIAKKRWDLPKFRQWHCRNRGHHKQASGGMKA